MRRWLDGVSTSTGGHSTWPRVRSLCSRSLPRLPEMLRVELGHAVGADSVAELGLRVVAHVPRFLGWGVIVITLIGGTLVSYSSRWLLGLAGAFILLDRR